MYKRQAAWCGCSPVVVAGDHPGSNFKIATVPKTKDEYFTLLKEPPDIYNDVKEEAVLFTAIHYRETFDENRQESIPSKLGMSLEEIEADETSLFSKEANLHANNIITELLQDIQV